LLCRAIVVLALVTALAVPSRAETLATAEKQVIAGIVVVSAAIGVLVTLLVLHYKHKNASITGCVVSATNGITLTDEKDMRTYVLSGDTTAVKPGERMTVAGKRQKKTSETPVFEAQKVRKDFGACQPASPKR
jgi:hypothetical protein